MANAHRGEVDIRIGERVAVLRFGWAAIAEIQNAFGKDFEVVFGSAILEMNVDVLSQILVIGLKEKWPEVTQQEIIAASPPLAKVTQAVQLALRYAFHGTEEDPAEPDKNPPQGRLKRALRKMLWWRH